MKTEHLIRAIEYKLFGNRVAIRREHARRKAIDKLRARTLCITPVDTVLQMLRLKGLMPDKLVALEPFGKCGIMKTLEYVHLCSSLEFFEIDEHYAGEAKRILPPSIVEVRVEDSIKAIQTGTLRRKDYNFVILDCPLEAFGPPGNPMYCENFDVIPKVFDYLADHGTVVLNAMLDGWIEMHHPLTPEHERRRREFFGVPSGPIVPTLESITKGYLAKVPTDRFEVEECFPVPHPGPMMFLVLCLKRKHQNGRAV
jgi:hypothetical protein